MTQVISYWKYDNLWNRLLRRKTFYHEVLEENRLLAYRLNKDASMTVVKVEPLHPESEGTPEA